MELRQKTPTSRRPSRWLSVEDGMVAAPIARSRSWTDAPCPFGTSRRPQSGTGSVPREVFEPVYPGESLRESDVSACLVALLHTVQPGNPHVKLYNGQQV